MTICNTLRRFLCQFSKKSWFWWSRQGRDGYSEFDVFKRSRVINRCILMPRTWSGVLWIDYWGLNWSKYRITCTGGKKIGLTLKIEFSTHRKVMDKPSWGLTKLITKFKFSFKKWVFVTPSVAFYVNFPKNHDFDGPDKAVMDILNLMCSNGPGWWIGAQGCLERGLESSGSILRSKLI